jgi:hypothetical protein
MNQKSDRIARRLLAIAAGGAVALAGLVVVLLGLGRGLEAGLVSWGLSPAVAAWVGPVAVGLLAFIIGGWMLGAAKQALADESVAPTETVAGAKAMVGSAGKS